MKKQSVYHVKSIAKLIETGTLHKYAKLRHAIFIFGDGNCFTLEDVIMSLCNSNCSQGLLRSPKSPRKIGNNAYSIRPDTYIVFPLYCMRCSVQANAGQRRKLTFRHLQYQQLSTYMWMILILCNGTSEEKYPPSCDCPSPRASYKLGLLSIWSSAKFQRSLWILKRTLHYKMGTKASFAIYRSTVTVVARALTPSYEGFKGANAPVSAIYSIERPRNSTENLVLMRPSSKWLEQ